MLFQDTYDKVFYLFVRMEDMSILSCIKPSADVIQKQDKLLAVKHDVTPMYFGKKPVDSSMVRMVAGLCLIMLFFLATMLTRYFSVFIPPPHQLQTTSTIEAHSAEDLLEQLKANNLWEMESFLEVPAVLVSKFPGDMASLDTATQKKAFLHVLLPAAMIALAEVEAERTALEKILAKFAQPPRRLNFDLMGDDYSRLAGLSQNEVDSLQNLCQKYRAYGVADLRRRISPVPVSLIMAQGALESSWGGSRFAREANNLFGVRTWSKGGIMSAGQELEEGKSLSYATYASLLDSVRAYILMLNRGPAYHALREIREETFDSLAMANGLLRYSERGSDYIADLTQLIRSNGLQSYDQCALADKNGLRGLVRIASLGNLR